VVLVDDLVVVVVVRELKAETDGDILACDLFPELR
jgi:hypothetical protein